MNRFNSTFFFDDITATVTGVVWDPATLACAIIDPVWDFDPQSGKTSTKSADKVIELVREKKLSVEWILETHIHADHLTAANVLKKKLGGKIGIGSKTTEILKHWVPIFNSTQDTPSDASQFDHLFSDNESVSLGSQAFDVWHTPGHTPACVCYKFGDLFFVGDTLFMPDVGTARVDFPGGDAATQYRSLQRILALPDDTKLVVGHDYPVGGRSAAWLTTVGEQKQKNILIGKNIGEADYVALRRRRDEGKAVPRLLLPALQVNLRAGDFGAPEANGVRYIKIPVDQL